MIGNERLIDYLGLELELCYEAPDGRYYWVLVDRIRRPDDIAREMLRVFSRFTRIGKTLARNEAMSISTASHAPYARCMAVRVRVHEMTCSTALRIGCDSQRAFAAPRLAAPQGLLDATLGLGLSDPILEMFASTEPQETGAARARESGGRPSGTSGYTTPAGDARRTRGRRARDITGQADAAAAITLDVQSGYSRQQASQSIPDHSPSTPATPSVTGSPSDESSSSDTSSKPK